MEATRKKNKNRLHRVGSYNAILASTTSSLVLFAPCHSPARAVGLQPTDHSYNEGPKARSTARAHRVHSATQLALLLRRVLGLWMAR